VSVRGALVPEPPTRQANDQLPINDLSAVARIVRKYSLANALKYNGKADARAVIGKLLAERPELRQKTRDIMELVNRTIEEVNAMSIEAQRQELEGVAPQLLESHHERREKELPPLEGATMGKVVTRLPPEPSGYPHVGHAYAGYINWYYARHYHGRLVLRFEDTNPRAVRKEYYEAFRDGYRWMGIDWDKELKVSDDIPYFYQRARELLQKGQAYLCSCPERDIKNGRRTGTECPHRNSAVEDNLAGWDDILQGKYHEGEIVCRLKVDMMHPNAVMRDPNMLRIIEHRHPFQGDRYRLWPTYDFAVALEDNLCGITHILRSNEFASRGELQAFIRSLFGFPQPRIQEFSRLNVEGSPVSKRQIRPLVQSKVISGWDDFRLATLSGLRHRGIIPETIKELTREVGLSVSHPVIDWSIILGINRRLIDPMANRFFAVANPVLVTITGATPRDAQLPLHPDFPDRGTRVVHVGSQIFIDGTDAKEFKRGDVFRLKHLYNVRVERKSASGFTCSYAGEEVEKAETKIQWVGERTVAVRMMFPDVLFLGEQPNPHSLRVEEGLGEEAMRTLEPGTIVQLERKGFGRIERAGDKVAVVMTG
jgi:glutamyl-tRNA synthetase